MKKGVNRLDVVETLIKYCVDNDIDAEDYYVKNTKFIKQVQDYFKNKNDYSNEDIYQYIGSKIHYDNALNIFANNFKAIMRQKQKSIIDVSRDLKISYSTVNDWYNGRSYPRADKIELLARYLLINTSDLTEEHSTRIPVLGRIPAGIPNEAIEYIEDWEEIPTTWLTSDREYFALKIHGNSMTPTYHDGDIVIFQRASRCDNR